MAASYPSFSTTPRIRRKRAAVSVSLFSAKKPCDENQNVVNVDTGVSPQMTENVPKFHDIVGDENNFGKDNSPLENPNNSIPEDESLNIGFNNSKLDKNIQTEYRSPKTLSFVKKITKNDKECFYYVGIPTVKILNFLFEWIKPAARKIKLWDGPRRDISGRKGGKTRKSLFEEMLLTLVKIRRGYGNKHLAYLFNISESHVCRIFIAWVNLLSQCLSEQIIWPNKEIVRSNMPHSFSNYPKTRAVIDCTEYFIQKPIRPAAQKATWSNYKHSNTLKQLIAITPCGTISFVSNIYNGSISDVAIVKESKFVDLVEEGDDIMADRGFNIRHLLLPKKATLNIPAFTHGKVLSSKAVKRSRQIAKVRIHVERAIHRMKTFRILSGIIPLKFRFILHQLTKIVAVLCNLQPCLA